MMTDLVLEHGLGFADLYDREGLVRLDRAFVDHLAETDVGLHDRLMTARRDPDALEHLEELNLVVDLAPISRIFSANCLDRSRDAGLAGRSS